jgi:hypothetical protein
MKRFVEGEDRSQNTLFPERLDEYIAEDNPVRVVDVFVDELDLTTLGFDGIKPEAQRTQIQFLDKGLNDPDWIVLADVIVQTLGK